MKIIWKALGFRAMKKEIENFSLTVSEIKHKDADKYLEGFIIKSLKDFHLHTGYTDIRGYGAKLKKGAEENKHYFLSRIGVPDEERYQDIIIDLEDFIEGMKEQYKSDTTHNSEYDFETKKVKKIKLTEEERQEENENNKEDAIWRFYQAEATLLYLKKNVKDLVISDMVRLTYLLSSKEPKSYSCVPNVAPDLFYFDDWQKDSYRRDWDKKGLLNFRDVKGFDNLRYYSLPLIIKNAEHTGDKNNDRRAKRVLSS